MHTPRQVGSYPADSPNRSYYIMSKRVTAASRFEEPAGAVSSLFWRDKKILGLQRVLTSTKKTASGSKKHLKLNIHFLFIFLSGSEKYIRCIYENFEFNFVVVVEMRPVHGHHSCLRLCPQSCLQNKIFA